MSCHVGQPFYQFDFGYGLRKCLPMKLRESGMPEESYWESLFDVEAIMQRLGIDESLTDVVELGCGYGTFTLPVARSIQGTITTTDIDPGMVARTNQRAKDARLSNVVCRAADVFADGFGVPPTSQDGCLLFNILHAEEPVRLLMAAAQVLRPSKMVFVIHWRFDPATPRGPSLTIRPKPEDIIAWSRESRILSVASEIIDLPPWHYGLRFARSRDVLE